MRQLNLEEYNDYELIYLAKENDDLAYEILQKKYKPIILSIAIRINRLYNDIGLELQDYIIEGMTALDHAIYYFNEDFDNIFYTYAIKYIEYYMLNKARKNRKDYYLNNSIELLDNINNNYEENDDISMKEKIKSLYIHLNPIEIKILKLKLRGFKYGEIAKKLNISKKKVDNTLLKIRKIIRSRKE